MTIVQAANSGPGTVYAAGTQNIYQGNEFVDPRPATEVELRACDSGWFVPPSAGWAEAGRQLAEHRFLVLVGEHGSGRRTAALRLLVEHCPPGQQIWILEPEWTQPRARHLPAGAKDCGYLLDLSELSSEPPRPELGEQLRSWAWTHETYLIVTITMAGWQDSRWRASLQAAAVELRSPDARLLVENELRAHGAWRRVPLLDDAAFADIWASSPKAEDACRLAEIIMSATELVDPKLVVDEYRDWTSWIDDTLPNDLDARLMFWSCAFCDGGSRKSILRMTESLHAQILGKPRTPAEILVAASTSKRLKSASLDSTDGVVRHDSTRHGLAAAVRRHLWSEYEDQLEPLRAWALELTETLPAQDAALVTESLLGLMIQFRDDTLLTGLRDKAARKRDSRVLDMLSDAALDPRFGAHVRSRLYTWLTGNPTPGVIDAVTEVCGGPLGVHKPKVALVRLRLAALKASEVRPTLTNTLATLADRNSALVLDAIARWFSEPTSERAGINAFLALASSEKGATILFGQAGHYYGVPERTDALVNYFLTAIKDPVFSTEADKVMKSWEELGKHGFLDEEALVALFGAALAPRFKDNIMRRFFLPSEPLDVNSFWGRVLTAAALIDHNRTIDVPQE